jgi:choline monooxygenase
MSRRELRRFDPSVPLESAHTPPYTWYTDQEMLTSEQLDVFEKNWLCVGRSDQVNGPGKYFTGHILGSPYVVVRGDDGVLRAFHNVCRHHAAEVAQGHGKCGELVCPYHGWSYRLNGSLRSAPHLGKVCNFDVDRQGLKAMSVEEWGPLVFIDMDGSWNEADKDVRDLQKDLEPIKAPLEELGISGMKHVERRVYDLNCNWKVFVDNGLDGGYHVAYAHERLASGLEFEGYQTHIFDRSSYQVCESNKSDKRLGDKVVYAWLFPNLFINRYGNCLDTNVVFPIAPDKCQVIIDWYFDFDNLEDWQTQKLIDRHIADSHVVQKEDIAVCESVQRGMRSMAFEDGRYSSKLEGAVHAFHKLLWKELFGRA